MSNLVGISVLVVNFNGEKYLTDAVDTIMEQIVKYFANYELLIYDNKSTDNSLLILEILKKKYRDRLTYFKSSENVGFARGNNILVGMAKFNNIILLNNDTKTINLDNTLNYIKNNDLKNNQILTSRVYNSDLTIQKNWFYLPKSIKLVFELFLFKFLIKKILILYSNGNDILKSDLSNTCFTGCFLVMTKDLYKKIGGFDECFLFYHEECDLFIRASKYNVSKIILEDSIIHYGGGGGEISRFAFVNYYKSLFVLYRKHNIIDKKKLLLLFKVAFAMRIFLLNVGILIPYSPFENLYSKQKNTRSKKEIIELHKDTLRTIMEASRKLSS